MLRQLFKTKPDARRDDYSRSHLEKGIDYQERFASLPGRAFMWKLEQQVLAECVKKAAPRRVLDFASGTGRVAGFLARASPETEIHGVDISESMLAVAKENCPDVHFHLLDARRTIEYFGPTCFDFVSAFRFFANADDTLRAEAAEQIAAVVKPGGWLVFNNHRNFWSSSYVAKRLASRGAGVGASNAELESLFLRRGFVRRRRYSLGIWPQSEAKAYWLPWSLTRWIERANLSATSELHSLGYNVIWLMRKLGVP